MERTPYLGPRVLAMSHLTVLARKIDDPMTARTLRCLKSSLLYLVTCSFARSGRTTIIMEEMDIDYVASNKDADV